MKSLYHKDLWAFFSRHKSDRAAQLIFVSLSLILLPLLIGCGPIQSTQRISSAEKFVEQARVANAAQRAPYEYFTAYHYLQKAKYEWGYSNFEISAHYATRARRAAEAALLKAHEDPWTGHPVRGASDSAPVARDKL